MKFEQLKKRLDRNRSTTAVTLQLPDDVLEDLQRVAPLLGFSNYQALIRAYIGQGLRADLEKLEQTPLAAFVESLRRHGVSHEVIEEALTEATGRAAP